MPAMIAADARADLPTGFKRRLLRQMTSEFGPLLAFFLGYLWLGLIPATGVYAAATAVSVGVGWMVNRRIPVLPLISAGLVALFAGLTIALQEAMFIKIKPTVTNGFYGLAIGLGWLFGFRLVERVLAPEIRLDEPGIKALTARVSAYLIGLALLNELVWRLSPTSYWILFKVFVVVALNLAFAASQVPLVRRHMRPANG